MCHHYFMALILYINSVSMSVSQSVEVLKLRSLLIKLSPRTQGPKNYLGPRVLISYFYFYVCFCAAIVGGPYFLLLCLFSRSNCQRSLLLTFTSVFAQQLPKAFTSYFCVCFRAATAGGPYFLLLRLFSFSRNNYRHWWERYFWAKGLGGSWFLFFSWRGEGVGVGF